MEITQEEQIKKEKSKRMKLQAKLKEVKKRADILTAVTIVMSLVALLAAFLLISDKLKPVLEDTDSRLSKDSALAVMLTSPLLSVNIDGRDIQIKSMPDMFTLLRTAGWSITADTPTGTPKVVFTVEPGYTLTLFDSHYVQIADGASTRSYKTDNAIAEDISTFIYDNTTLTSEDLSSLISQTKEVFFNSDYYSDYLAAGSGLAAALDPVSWKQIDFYPAGSDPSTTITAWDNVTVSLYDSDKISVVIFNGNAVYYSFTDTVLEDLRSYIGKILSAQAVTLKNNLMAFPELNLTAQDKAYTVIPDETFAALLKAEEWKILFEAPQLPASPYYELTDGEAFSLRLYKEQHVAEVNGGEQYYDIPEDIFTQIAAYIAKTTAPSLPEPPENMTDPVLEGLKNALKVSSASGEKVSVTFDKNAFSIKASEELAALLLINEWTEAEMPDSLNPDSAEFLALTVSGKLSVNVYPDYGICCISSGDEVTGVYSAPAKTLYNDLSVYAKANAVEETVTLSAEALYGLLKGQTNVKTAVYDGVNTHLASGSDQFAADISEWISSLSLKALEQKPTVSTDRKSVLTFTGSLEIILTFTNLADGSSALNVSSKNDTDGTVINNWFTVLNQNYMILNGQITAYMYAMQDKLAADFAAAFKNGDMDTISECLLQPDPEIWGYDKFFSARLSSSVISAGENGDYILTFTVEDSKESGLPEGENIYRLTVAFSQTANRLYISSFVTDETYRLTAQADNDEVQTVIRFITRCTGEQFTSPSEINKNSLINFCMLLLRSYGDASRTSFTQADINAAALKYFALESLSDAASPLFDAETGLYTISSAAAVAPVLTLTGLKNEGDLCYVTVARSSDPLGLFTGTPVTYTLRRMTEKVQTGTPEAPVESERNYFMYISAVNADG